MSYKDYYKILGIEKEASTKEVEDAYLKLSARFNREDYSDDDMNQAISQDIAEAFMVLSDSELRTEYDLKGTDWELPDAFDEDSDNHDEELFEEGEDQTIDDIAKTFRSLFENGFKEAVRMSKQQEKLNAYNNYIKVDFSLSEAMEGATKTITYQDEDLDIPIPKGAFTGQMLRFPNKGKLHPDGQTTGDLWITLLEKPHQYFFRKGNNVLYHASVDVYTALLGGKITVPTLKGKVKIKIPNSIISNGKIKVPGEGLPVFNKPDERGDFFVELHIEMPRDFSEEEIALIKQLRDLRKNK